MASKRQKVHHQSMDSVPATSSDLISDLPKDIIMNILLRLPLQEAVKTSLLSKGWRYKWITIPHLIFNHSTFTSPAASKLVNSSNSCSSDLLAIIRQLLFQHEGPITKFQLVVPQLQSCPEIDPLISFLSRKNIEEFTLIWQGNHKIPSYLFSCLKMRLLCLRECVLNPPQDFSGFAKLTKLVLFSVELPASFAETFVARCLLLERLKLAYCTNLDSVDFYAPNLQILSYLGEISSISFKNTPNLKRVYIEERAPKSLKKSSSNTWIDTFCSLASVEYLQVGGHLNLMLDASVIHVGDTLASQLTCLATLELHLFSEITGRGALSLIRSSPNLQKLKVFFYLQKDAAAGIQVWKDKETWGDVSLEKVQSIEISHFRGLEAHMAFIELLLAKSPMLETLHLFHFNGLSVDEKFSALQKLNQVPRASPRAKVILLEEKLSG